MFLEKFYLKDLNERTKLILREDWKEFFDLSLYPNMWFQRSKDRVLPIINKLKKDSVYVYRFNHSRAYPHLIAVEDEQRNMPDAYLPSCIFKKLK